MLEQQGVWALTLRAICSLLEGRRRLGKMAQGKVCPGDLHQWLTELSASGSPVPGHITLAEGGQPRVRGTTAILGSGWPTPKEGPQMSGLSGTGAKFKSHGSTEEP